MTQILGQTVKGPQRYTFGSLGSHLRIEKFTGSRCPEASDLQVLGSSVKSECLVKDVRRESIGTRDQESAF